MKAQKFLLHKSATRVHLLRTLHHVRRLIDVMKIDTLYLTDAEARRLEMARRLIAKRLGTRWP